MTNKDIQATWYQEESIFSKDSHISPSTRIQVNLDCILLKAGLMGKIKIAISKTDQMGQSGQKSLKMHSTAYNFLGHFI